MVIAILVLAEGGRRDPKWVFTHFENNSGWPDGWSFCVGLLHAAYGTSSTGMIISYVLPCRHPLAFGATRHGTDDPQDV